MVLECVMSRRKCWIRRFAAGRCCVDRTCVRCLHPLTHFFHSLNHPRFSASMDVYAPMFFCDLVTFLIVVFGYDKFGPSVNSLSFDFFHISLTTWCLLRPVCSTIDLI